MEVFNQVCALGQVRIRLTIGNIPPPNTRHPVSWIRTNGGSHGFTSQELIAFTTNYIRTQFLNPPGSANPFIVVHVNLTFPHMYIAHELTRYNGAVLRVQTHEAGHTTEWCGLMIRAMSELQTNINSLIYRQAANVNDRQGIRQQVHQIIQGEYTQWIELLRQNSDNWDRNDYPSLHQVLRGLGVPAL